VVLWLALEPSRISAAAKAEIEQTRSTGSVMMISDITLWEIASLLQRKRIRLDVERHLLAFREAADARRFERGGVDEHVLGAAFRRDESETLGGIEELHGTVGHCLVFHNMEIPPRAHAHGGRGKRNIRVENDFPAGSARATGGSYQQKRFV